MKTASGMPAAEPGAKPAAIVHLADGLQPEDAGEAEGAQALARARAFAEPLLAGQLLDTGEDALAHADGVAAILQSIGAAPSMRAAAYLVYAGDHLQRPEETVAAAFGAPYATLVNATRRLVQAQRSARAARVEAERQAQQVERVRKMLLAFASDLRVVLLRLASRLQTLRWFAADRRACPEALARESLDVFAPLANRLGIWPIKWQLEDLAFRFLMPDAYRRIAAQIDGSRLQREAAIAAARERLAAQLAAAGVRAEVQGRPKHLYSVWRKMRGKHLGIDRIYDLRALRVIVDDIAACYTALALVHERYTFVPGEFDDYIARPKANGYQSLHTVVRGADGAALEVQIRTRQMHERAEHGVAAHWAYKEAGARGYVGVSAAGAFEERVAEARRAVLRELLAWERELSAPSGAGATAEGLFDDRIYVFTPQAAVIELPAGATPVDFAYALHTNVGHRCRGAKVDGVLVSLHTPLSNGQTVEIVTARDGGPSRDWLGNDPVYLRSPRARAKVRAWFNALAQAATIARGRELVDKLLQREGRTAVKLEALAEQLGFADADALFEAVGKDEYSLHQIEQLLRPPPAATSADELVTLRRPRADAAADKGGVLVVGVESLLTNLARCCRPAPPDAIGGFVTRDKGVAIHRADCRNYRHMLARSPERAIAVAWGRTRGEAAMYAVDLQVEAEDRQGLLRDISELLAKERMNVTGVQSRSVRDARGRTAWMTFTVEVDDATRLGAVLAQVGRVPGVRSARRR